MADNASSPLLGTPSASDRPTSTRSHQSDESHENTPLLSRSDDTPRYDGEDDHEGERLPSPAATSLRSLQNGGGSTKSTKGGRRWPTIVAISILGVAMISIITGAFFAPAVVEEYAKESLVIEPTNLSIHNITSTGVVARVQANFRMDASRVKNKHVRNIGRFGTWIAREVETKESTVNVYIKSLDLHIGTAIIPRIVVDIRNGHTTALNFLTDLQPGDVEGLRQVANDWLEGRLHEITLRGEGDIGLKSGLFSLGTQSISEELHFEGQSLYNAFASFYFGEKTLV
jgi:hypothetical protein